MLVKIKKCGQVLQGEGNKPLRLCIMRETGQNCSRGRCSVSPSLLQCALPVDLAGPSTSWFLRRSVLLSLWPLLPREAMPCLNCSWLLRSGHFMDDVLERRALPSHAVDFGCLFKDNGCQPSNAVTLQYLLQWGPVVNYSHCYLNNCDFATVRKCNLNICIFRKSWDTPLERSLDNSPRGVTTHMLRTTVLRAMNEPSLCTYLWASSTNVWACSNDTSASWLQQWVPHARYKIHDSLLSLVTLLCSSQWLGIEASAFGTPNIWSLKQWCFDTRKPGMFWKESTDPSYSVSHRRKSNWGGMHHLPKFNIYILLHECPPSNSKPRFVPICIPCMWP